VNFAKAAGNPGFEHGYATMPDAWKLRLAEHFYRMWSPPPHNSVLRVFRHENVGIHFSTPVLNVAVHGEALEVDTSARKFEADHLVVATGFKVDWQMHPEYAPIRDKIRLWGDVLPEEQKPFHGPLANIPYLNEFFQFLPRQGSELPGLENIFCFCFASSLSFGLTVGMIPGVSLAARKLAQFIASGFYREEEERLYEKMLRFDDAELHGGEWPAS